MENRKMFIKTIKRVICSLLLLIVLSTGVIGCTSSSVPLSPTPLSPAAPPVPQLRITNNGNMPIENLSVLFPDDEIRFGSISPGTTSEYQDVPNGVYAYAAYRFEIDGEMILQPVIDWVGERPLDGDTFTYVITFSPNQPQWQMVRLVEVINE